MIEQYVWLAAIFIAASLAYWAGTAFGRADADRAQTPQSWENVRKHVIDANADVAKYKIRMEHEEQMRLIERGIFDHAELDEETEDEDDTD